MSLEFNDFVPNMESSSDLSMDVALGTTEGLHCVVCGVPLTYAGRGKRPKYCPDHGRRRSGASVTGTGTTTAKNEQLAIQAASALVGVNGLVEIIVGFAGLPETAATMRGAKEAFREQAQTALLNDPDLCRTIIAGGGMSAKLSLVVAYGMLGSVVIPTGVAEWRAKHPRDEDSE